MIRVSELKLPLPPTPDDAAVVRPEAPLHPDATLRRLAAERLGVEPSALASLRVFKRSFDARKKHLLVVYIVDVGLGQAVDEAALLEAHAGNPHIRPTPDMEWTPPVQAPADFGQAPGQRPVVVGFGPCGLFAALALAQMGLRPIVLERGRRVRDRTKDTWALWRDGVLRPESNVQFGEGGAGLFSDGKLYSQIKDPRHLGRKVMREFVEAGAPPEILFVAHPHIGTFKLVKVVERMRATIERLGGEIRFEQRVTDLLLEPNEGGQRVAGVELEQAADGSRSVLPARHVVLALGHSARDTFAMLHERGVLLEAKPFSIGVRIEHPQGLIDRARWGRHAGNPLLGAADYKLVHHAGNGRSVYSFCMCPGGTVVAATSEEGRVVTNGMSEYSRNERNANAGLVVGIGPEDAPTDPALWRAAFGDGPGARYAAEAATLRAEGRQHPLAGVVLQRDLEARAFEAGGATYRAPVQRVEDFLAGRPSTAFGSVEPSYRPGVCLGDVGEVLPGYAAEAIREAIPALGRKLRGFDLPDAILTAVETRTSSPLRITRGPGLQSLNTAGLYPAGEGAGYAGGILSAGVDGIKAAEALARAALDA